MHFLKFFNKADLSFGLSCILGITVLVLSGATYRFAASKLEPAFANPVTLPMALGEIPMELGKWQGKDVPIPEYVQQATGNDDYLYRIFANKSTGQWVGLYVAYSGRPATMLGHRPQVCYIAEGWVYEDAKMASFVSADQKNIPCMVSRFYKPDLVRQERVVLNFYVLNGQIIADLTDRILDFLPDENGKVKAMRSGIAAESSLK